MASILLRDAEKTQAETVRRSHVETEAEIGEQRQRDRETPSGTTDSTSGLLGTRFPELSFFQIR